MSNSWNERHRKAKREKEQSDARWIWVIVTALIIALIGLGVWAGIAVNSKHLN